MSMSKHFIWQTYILHLELFFFCLCLYISKFITHYFNVVVRIACKICTYSCLYTWQCSLTPYWLYSYGPKCYKCWYLSHCKYLCYQQSHSDLNIMCKHLYQRKVLLFPVIVITICIGIMPMCWSHWVSVECFCNMF